MMMSLTPNRPSVKVPVLSNTAAVRLRALSKADLSRISGPLPALSRGADGDHQWNREPERMRTGDDHHGHHALDGEFVILAGEQPEAQ
jgi:hypothetical protein